MGVIINGKYHPDRKSESSDQNTTVSGIAEENALNRMYEDHAHNLIQPHNKDGTPNQDFIDYFPEDAQNYGFIKEDQDASN